MWSKKLKELRLTNKKKPMTQTQLGKLLNVSRSQVAKYESADRQPNFEEVERVISYFDIWYDYFFSDLQYDIVQFRQVQQELSERNQRQVPMTEAINICTERGCKEILKEIKLEQALLGSASLKDESLNEVIERINYHTLNYKLDLGPLEKAKAITEQLSIWGIYNEMNLTEDNLDLVRKHLEFLIVNYSK